MGTVNKEQFWQDHIAAWQGSGLSQAAYWRNRLSPAKVPSAKLMKLGGMPASSRMIMNLPLGVRLELYANDWPVVFPAVLHILRDLS
jgi:hypothetical protein